MIPTGMRCPHRPGFSLGQGRFAKCCQWPKPSTIRAEEETFTSPVRALGMGDYQPGGHVCSESFLGPRKFYRERFTHFDVALF